MKMVRLLVRRAVRRYNEDNASYMAAAISYYVLFSVVPLAFLLVAVFGLAVRDGERQQDVARGIVGTLNIESGDATLQADDAAVSARYDSVAAAEVAQSIQALGPQERERVASKLEEGDEVTLAGRSLGPDELSVSRDNVVTDSIAGASRVSGPLSVAGLIGLAWSATAMFAALRASLNIVWRAETKRPFVQQKLVDLGMVLGLGLLLGASMALTATLRVLRELSDDNLGPLSTGTGVVWSVLPLFLPAAFSFAAFIALYRYVPNAPTSVRTVWPGALIATVLFEALKNSFAFYVAKFNNYDAAYGSLGGILLFLLWTYFSASIVLFGAELAAEYSRVLEEPAQETQGPRQRRSLPQTVRRAVSGRFLSHRD